MKTLQELLDEVNQNKLCQLSDGTITHKIRGSANINRLNSDKERLKERGKLLGKTFGKFNLSDHSREMSQVPTLCPNCGTVGPLSNMVQHHMDNCKRTTNYSNQTIIDNFVNGMSMSQIANDSNVSYSQVKSIIRDYKKNLAN